MIHMVIGIRGSPPLKVIYGEVWSLQSVHSTPIRNGLDLNHVKVYTFVWEGAMINSHTPCFGIAVVPVDQSMRILRA